MGSDGGRFEREEFIDEVLLAPSERAVIDVLFDARGDVHLEHRTPDHTYDLGVFTVAGDRVMGAANSFDELRVDSEPTAAHQSIQPDLDRPPDKVLAFFSRMPLLYGDGEQTAAAFACPMHPEVTSTEPGTCPDCGMKLVAVEAVPSSYVCPMHPDVTSSEPGTCPECGMKLVAVEAGPTSYACPMHPEVTSTEPGTCPECGMKLVPSDAAPDTTSASPVVAGHGEHEHGDGLEWEDLMPEINRASDPSNMIWQLIDRETGAENGAISWNFTVGDRVKIRLVNEMEADHPMHHPFHIHGAGRFLVLSRDEEPEANLVWKDTVLVRSGETVDILLDVSNPGLWMAHCHIAEHNQSGMMFSFNVSRRPTDPQHEARSSIRGPCHLDSSRLGCFRRSAAGGLTARLLVARTCDRLRAITRAHRIDLHRVRGLRRTMEGHRRGMRRRERVRRGRGHLHHGLSVVPRRWSGGPRSEGLVATPNRVRSQHPLVAPVLRCDRFRRRWNHRDRDSHRFSPLRLVAANGLVSRRMP